MQTNALIKIESALLQGLNVKSQTQGVFCGIQTKGGGWGGIPCASHAA